MTILVEVRRSFHERMREADSIVGSLPADSGETMRGAFREPLPALLKGIVFVVWYGAWEQVVLGCVRAAMTAINHAAIEVRQLRSPVMSMALHSSFDRVQGVGRKGKWSACCELLERMRSNETVTIVDGAAPISGSNIDTSEISIIFRTFGFSPRLVEDTKIMLRIDEIVRNRNEIAHGRIAPAKVGRRYTRSELLIHGKEIEQLGEVVCAAFERYIDNRCFLSEVAVDPQVHGDEVRRRRE